MQRRAGATRPLAKPRLRARRQRFPDPVIHSSRSRDSRRFRPRGGAVWLPSLGRPLGPLPLPRAPPSPQNLSSMSLIRALPVTGPGAAATAPHPGVMRGTLRPQLSATPAPLPAPRRPLADPPCPRPPRGRSPHRRPRARTREAGTATTSADEADGADGAGEGAGEGPAPRANADGDAQGDDRGAWLAIDGAHGPNPDPLPRSPPPRRPRAPTPDVDAFPPGPALDHLWVTWAICCFVERGWRFGFGITLGLMEGGFHAIAVCGFLQHLAAMALAPAAGALLDRSPRVPALTAILVGQNALVLVTALYVMWGAAADPAFLLQPLHLCALGALQVLQRVANALSDVAIERDWVVVLTQRRPALLAEGNAHIRRVDQVAEISATFAFGLALSRVGVGGALASAAACAALLTPAQVLAINGVARICGTALDKPPHRDAREAAGTGAAALGAMGALRSVTSSLLDSWRLFFRQPSLLPSLALVALFFNTAMAPSGILTAYLIAQGMTGTAAAAFRSLCAGAGLVGIWVGTRVIKRAGIISAGALALLSQAAMCAVAAALFLGYTAAGQSSSQAGWSAAATGLPAPLLLFCVFVALSRIGLWMYDMVDAQVFQTMVKPRVAGSVSTVEAALCSLTELVMMGVAVMLTDVEHFWVMVAMSMSAVALSLATYLAWMAQGAGEQYRRSESRLNGAALA